VTRICVQVVSKQPRPYVAIGTEDPAANYLFFAMDWRPLAAYVILLIDRTFGK